MCSRTWPCHNAEEHPGKHDDSGRGCVHHSSTGSDVDDRHKDGGHG